MPVNTGKSSHFLILGDKLSVKGFRLGQRPAPPVHWRLRVSLSFRPDGRVVGDVALRLRPIGLRGDRLPSRRWVCPPASCGGAGCCLARSTPHCSRGRVRLPGRLQPLVWWRRRQRFLVWGQPDSRWQPTRHGLELEKLDQQDDHNDRDRLRHDGGERPENGVGSAASPSNARPMPNSTASTPAIRLRSVSRRA
jgi:hypothetical protein